MQRINRRNNDVRISALTQGTWKLVLAALVLLPAPLLMGASNPNTRPHAMNGGMMSTSVALWHLPTGTASLSWKASTGMLTVTLTLTGLAPSSIHPAHIHAGMCNGNGPAKYTLNAVRADMYGNGNSTTTLRNISGGIPPGGWSINVHNGPGMTQSSYAPRNQDAVIACAAIVNSNGYYSGDQTMCAQFHPTMDADQMAYGYANMWIQNNTLYVELYMRNLEPFSEHAAHIHTGSCERQGGVVHMLHDVQVDSNGNGSSFTAVSGVSSIPASGWYINTHLGNSSEIGTQTGFDPIACADIM
jgi:hypothetical protein